MRFFVENPQNEICTKNANMGSVDWGQPQKSIEMKFYPLKVVDGSWPWKTAP